MKQYNIDIALTAKEDIRSISRYIAFDLRNRVGAEKFLDSIDRSISSLEDMPERYPLVSDSYLANYGLRFITVGKFLVFYIVSNNNLSVRIIRVIHGKRNWTKLLKENDLSSKFKTGVFHD